MELVSQFEIIHHKIFNLVFSVSHAAQAMPVNEMCKSDYFVGCRSGPGIFSSFSSTNSYWKVRLNLIDFINIYFSYKVPEQPAANVNESVRKLSSSGFVDAVPEVQPVSVKFISKAVIIFLFSSKTLKPKTSMQF